MAPRDRLPSIDLTPEPWPNFTDVQVSFLEKMYPPRCIGREEQIEDHIRYAAKVELIAQLRQHVFGNPAELVLDEFEEDALDDEAVAEARAQGLIPNDQD